MLFVPKVYAFTYNVDTSVPSLIVKEGTQTEIKVSLNSIKGTDDGIASCTFGIEFDNNILLDSKVRSLGSWTLTIGKIYLLDSSAGVLDSSDLIVIPVKVNGSGNVKLKDIECSDGNELVKVKDKTISFTVDNEVSDLEDVDDSNSDLSDIVLSEGEIEFSPDIVEYYITVSSYDDLDVMPVLGSNKASYELRKEDNKVVIEVIAEDGSAKTYSIFVEETTTSEDNDGGSNSYIPIFVAIICVLVLINVFRIIKNKNNKETE